MTGRIIFAVRYLLQSGLYPAHQSLSESAIPDNDAHTGLVEGIFQAHKLYGNPSFVFDPLYYTVLNILILLAT